MSLLRLGSRHPLSTSARSLPFRRRVSRFLAVSTLGTTAALSTALYFDAGPSETISRDPLLHTEPLTALLRTYFVYTACSIPPLVERAPALLDTLLNSSVPGVSSITSFFVRHTFFAHVRVYLVAC